jgi:hypothetical protein
MTVERLAETVGDVADRRGFLKRTGAATIALLGLAGLVPGKASALYTTHGCDLCQAPGSCGPELYCAWCWIGRCHYHNGTPHRQKCCEGYRQTTCSGSCPSYCSYIFGSYAC